MADKMPVVHDRVWELLQRMRDSVDQVGRFYRAGYLRRPALERPEVDRYRVGVYTSRTPVVYGAADHRGFKDWIAPGAAKRIGQRLRGPEAADRERHDSLMSRRSLLIDSLEGVAGKGYAAYNGIEAAITRAWIASHFDRVIDDLRGSDHLPSDVAELRLGWDDAAADQKQQILADLHPNAPSAYAFAEAVGERAGMSAERTLHWLNNQPSNDAAYAAAGSLIGQAAVPRRAVEKLIRTEFDNGTPGRRIAELAIELIDQLDQPPARPEPEIDRDPRIGLSAPGSPSNGAGQAAAGTTNQPKRPGQSLAKG